MSNDRPRPGKPFLVWQTRERFGTLTNMTERDYNFKKMVDVNGRYWKRWLTDDDRITRWDLITAMKRGETMTLAEWATSKIENPPSVQTKFLGIIEDHR